MDKGDIIAIEELCTHYQLEPVFFDTIHEFGLIECSIIDESKYVHQEIIKDIETIIHLHLELEINLQGVEAILHLLQKVNHLQSELDAARIKLNQFEI